MDFQTHSSREEQEYNNFVSEFTHKAKEVQKDYDKLSEKNKIRINNWVRKLTIS